MTTTPPQSKLLVAIYDAETDGLLNELTKFHCLGIHFSDERGYVSYADQPGYPPIVDGIRELEKADIRVAHNALGFDEQAILKVYPWFKPKGKVIDTLILSKLLYPEMFKDGPNNHKLPTKMRKSHSLDAWGRRLGNFKGNYTGGWDHWSVDMQEYMDQDVALLRDLFRFLMGKKPSHEALDLEQEFAWVIARQERRGFTFDYEAAAALADRLQAKEAEIEQELIDFYGLWWEHGTAKGRAAVEDGDMDDMDDPEQIDKAIANFDVVRVKKTRRVKMTGFPDVTIPRISEKTGKPLKPYVGPPLAVYEEGAVYTPVRRTVFSPGSRDHVRKMLQQRHGWKPTKMTKGGSPVVDDDVLRGLTHIPEAQRLADYYLLDKRLGQLSRGRGAWMKCAVAEGREWRIYGRVNTIGTVTFRCSHSNPNIAQVPSSHAEYGPECRALFIARKGYKLVGYDGSSLQLRFLGHYLHKYDGGEYARIVDSEDPHAWARDTIGVDLVGEGDEGRGKGKRVVYAKCFGAGLLKIGSIIAPHASAREMKEIGAAVNERLQTRFEALASLDEALRMFAEEKGYLPGLDGRHLRVRKAHAALNTLLMAAEAVVMKLTKVKADRYFQVDGKLRAGHDYEFVADIHDEHQLEALPDAVEVIKQLAPKAHFDAGEHFKLRCPMRANVLVGTSWKDTH